MTTSLVLILTVEKRMKFVPPGLLHRLRVFSNSQTLFWNILTTTYSPVSDLFNFKQKRFYLKCQQIFVGLILHTYMLSFVLHTTYLEVLRGHPAKVSCRHWLKTLPEKAILARTPVPFHQGSWNPRFHRDSDSFWIITVWFSIIAIHPSQFWWNSTCFDSHFRALKGIPALWFLQKWASSGIPTSENSK